MVSLRSRLKNKEVTIGTWITMSDPAVAEIMARAGFDWVAVDMEHSALSFDQVQSMIRTVELSGVPPLVRVMKNDPDLIKRCMDAGAHGVIVPHVNSKEDAERAVSAVKYPPLGTRGVGLARGQRYSLDLDSYLKWNHLESVVIVQVEHIEAVQNLEEIMGVEGVDGFIVGRYDLSGSLGKPGAFGDPEVQEALERIGRIAKKNDYLFGEHSVTTDPREVAKKISEGCRFMGYGVDFLFLGESCRMGLGAIREGL
jgi:2-keto-3-deoxy-L-rhamnonate aldolase RhmA